VAGFPEFEPPDVAFPNAVSRLTLSIDDDRFAISKELEIPSVGWPGTVGSLAGFRTSDNGRRYEPRSHRSLIGWSIRTICTVCRHKAAS